MLAPDTRAAVEGFFQAWESASRRKQEHLRSMVPIAAMQQSAVDHEDPWVRRRCLGFLDHYAAETSAAVFVKALDDPVAPVRDIALHGLACEQCRTAELCVTDVTPKVVRVLESDPNPEVRFKALPILRRLSS
jgi:HEAT repeat protein